MGLADNIRFRRQQVGMSQQQLADAMGYKTRSTIARIESGDNDIPHAKLVRMAQVLGVSVDELLAGEPGAELAKAAAQSAREAADGARRKTVYMTTSSDILHEGILNVIDRGSEYGDVVVGVLTDEVIASYKRTPLLPLEDRMRVYASVRNVSRVVEQKTLSYRDVLLDLRPDYVIHGDDWRTGVQSSIRTEVVNLLDRWGGQLIEVPYTHGVSATGLEKDLRAFLGSPDARRGQLRKLLGLKPCLRAIEASNGLSGLIVEAASVTDAATGRVSAFDALWVSSLCDSTFKGKPDIELVDFTSRLGTIEEIIEVTTKPIILDGGTGGQVEHFVYNVQTLERLGVSAVVIEDRAGRKAAWQPGAASTLLQEDPHDFARKIRAGKKALLTRDFMVFACIESLLAQAGVDDALERAAIYLDEGGADGIMVDSRESDGRDALEFLQRMRQRWPEVPAIAVPTTFNHLTEQQLADAGARIVIHANHLLRAACKAMTEVADSILRNGRSLEADDLCVPIKQVLALIAHD